MQQAGMGTPPALAYDAARMTAATDTHRFPPRTEHLLDRATDFCSRENMKLTSLRRQVLGLMLESARPMGAYDLLEQLRTLHEGAAPPTVYRALDFLLELGLIHKIERLSAFVPCLHTLEHDHGLHAHEEGEECLHSGQFLICRECSQVTELEDAGILAAIVAASRKAGFRMTHSTIEIEGVCARCAGAAHARA
ncbi:Fur family transcriptional regulator [Acetobacter estunensis]|nr:Fur family transcriptional regulator [Acetobacter estunensis]